MDGFFYLHSHLISDCLPDFKDDLIFPLVVTPLIHIIPTTTPIHEGEPIYLQRLF